MILPVRGATAPASIYYLGAYI